jgi:competence protein ComEC
MQRTSAPNIAGAPLPQRARGYWRERASAASEGLERLLEAERTQLPPWFVVGLGSGIAAWFAFGQPGQWVGFLCVSAALTLAGFAVGNGRAGRAIGWFFLTATIGCALVWARSEWVRAPRFERPRVLEVTGTVQAIDHLAAKRAIRLLIRPASNDVPSLVRVSVDQDELPSEVASGAVVRIRARLALPPPMALPGTYDFSRDAWFKGIGAVGKGLGPVEVVKPARSGGIERLRADLRQHIADRLPERPAGIAIALATGDQNSVNEDDAEAMRRSGLTHLLSVSGLHIAAAVAAAMLLALKLLALSEWLALRFNLILVSAGAGALAGVGYTMLTGAQVPTVRSCVAALLVLAGLALGRDAISIRLIAAGALLVLLFRPEAIAGASFQMSFAAVTAIVALHSTAFAQRWFRRRDEGIIARSGRALLAMVMTGLAVEVALIPFALFHFHRAGLYGVGANIIAIPLTTFAIMPVEAAALLLDAVGLGKPLWIACGVSIDGLLWLAQRVASAKGAVAMLPSMAPWAFGLMVGGGLWLCLWNTRLRLFGIAPIAIGAIAAAASPRPDILVTGDGRHLAVVDPGGTPLLLRERIGDFVRDIFAEASAFDDDPAGLEGRPFTACSNDACVVSLADGSSDWRLLATRSRNRIDWAALTTACAQADIVVSERWLPQGCTPRWLKLDRASLAHTGGVAIFLGSRPRIETVTERVGHHPWATPVVPTPRQTATPPVRSRRDR